MERKEKKNRKGNILTNRLNYKYQEDVRKKKNENKTADTVLMTERLQVVNLRAQL